MVEVILQYQNQVKFFIQILYFYSYFYSDDSHQQPVQLNINEPVRFSSVSSSPPTQYKQNKNIFIEYNFLFLKGKGRWSII